MDSKKDSYNLNLIALIENLEINIKKQNLIIQNLQKKLNDHEILIGKLLEHQEHISYDSCDPFNDNL